MILAQAAPLTSATVAADVGSLVAPTTGIGVFLYGAYLIVRLYREGRSEQVKAARERAQAAELRALEAQQERDQDIASLRQQVNALEDELRSVRSEMAAQRYAHDRQVRDAYRRLETEIRVGHRLTQWCIEHGIGLPPDLDPARPDVAPQLGAQASPRAKRTEVKATWTTPDYEPTEPNPEGVP